jgi:hypothetical protein
LYAGGNPFALYRIVGVSKEVIYVSGSYFSIVAGAPAVGVREINARNVPTIFFAAQERFFKVFAAGIRIDFYGIDVFAVAYSKAVN